jgi:hypothetical protein
MAKKRKAISAGVHVIRSETGWASTSGSKATKIFATQSDAIQAAKRYAIRFKTEVVIHDRDGRIREAISFDPSPGTRNIRLPAVSGGKPRAAFDRAAIKARRK